MGVEDIRERTDLSIAVICSSGVKEVWKCCFECVEGAKDVNVHEGLERVCGELCYGREEVACCTCSVWSIVSVSVSNFLLLQPRSANKHT